MEQLTGVLGILLIFGAIIAVHEFGHFICAKLSRMGVYEFSLGFGPALFKKEYHGTLYALRIIPFGGYVRIAGMEVGEADAPNGYDKKPFFAKFATLIAGVVMNFILAFILVVIIGTAIGYMNPGKNVVISGVSPNSPADKAGLRAQDRIIAIGGKQYPTLDEARESIKQSRGPVTIVVQRDTKTLTLKPKPVELDTFDRGKGLIYHRAKYRGIGVGLTTTDGTWRRVGFVASIQQGFTAVMGTIVEAFAQFVSMVTGHIPLNQMGGPLMIMNAAYDTAATTSITRAWFFNVFERLALFSVLVGFFNLLPLPALDGGRLMFLIVEGIRGKALDKEQEAKIHAVGMAALLLFIVFISIKDVFKIFGG